MRLCKTCNEPIPAERRANARYCSAVCGGNQGPRKPRAVSQCAECGDAIPEHKPSNAKYCTERCKKSVEYRRYYDSKRKLTERVRVNCTRCGEPIGSQKKLDSLYCTAVCKRRDNRDTHNNNRDGLKRSNGGYVPFSGKDWTRLKNRHNNRCAYCGESKPLERDHVVPLSRGGRHALANILPACRQCNQSKKDKFLVEWRLGLGLSRNRAARLL